MSYYPKPNGLIDLIFIGISYILAGFLAIGMVIFMFKLAIIGFIYVAIIATFLGALGILAHGIAFIVRAVEKLIARRRA